MSDRVIQTAWRGHYMEPAFWAFVRFNQKHRMPAYFDETGDTYRPASDPLGNMIDTATGADFDFVQRFVTWCEGEFGTPEQVCGPTEDRG